MTMTITYIENLQKAIPETSDLWDIWPEWHVIMIWPETTKTKTIREHPERAIKEIFTYETMTGTKTKLFIKSVTLDPPVAKGLIVIITFIGYQHKLETQKKRTCVNKGQISSNWLDEAPSKVSLTDSLTDWETFWKHNNRVTQETCEVWDIWSEWWGDKTWPTKRQWQRQRQRQSQRQIHLESTFKERS